MNKTELILRIAEETGFSRKNVELGLNAAINLITKALTEEEKVQIVGFGGSIIPTHKTTPPWSHVPGRGFWRWQEKKPDGFLVSQEPIR